MRSGWVNFGPFIERFEDEFAARHGAKYGVATTSGTTALHLAYLAAGVGPGVEVRVPALTCVATANAVRYCNGEVSIADVNINDWMLSVSDGNLITVYKKGTVNPKHLWNIGPGTVIPVLGDLDKSIKFIQPSETPNAKIVVPVNLYGAEIQQKFPAMTILDAAQAIGLENILEHADMATFSFSGNKTITTGQGGMVLTNNKSLFQRMRFLRQQAQFQEGDYWHSEIGYNYRMTNIQAALGCAQLEMLDEILKEKKFINDYYRRSFEGRVQFQDSKRSTNWMTAIRVEKKAREVMDRMKEAKIETRPSFYPLNLLPMYKGYCPIATMLHEHIMVLPSHPDLTEQDLEYICKTLLSAL